jgi:CxxC motif-containing protein (DUF1111 family)
MNARRTGRLGSPTIVAGIVVLGCTAVALTAARSLGLFGPASDPEGGARPQGAADLFADGREQFTRIRHADGAVDPKVTAHRLFNARSCAECHGGVGGAGPNENNVQLLTGLSFSRVSPSRLVSTAGSAVLHRRSLAPEYADWREQLIERLAPRMPARVSSGGGKAVDMRQFGPFEERNTPPLFGLGLIESIPQSAIDANALSQLAHVRGRAPHLKEGGFGRFGWKSNNATLLAFNENACAVELGLTTPGFAPATFRASEMAPSAVRPGSGSQSHVERREPVMKAAAPPAPPDMSAYDVTALTHYVASLPAPRQVISASKRREIAAGERYFRDVGCAACHTPNLGGVTGLYSDLLLHSIGTKGGGSFYGGSPSESGPDPRSFDFVRSDEFRTPPLWGVADSGPYLHDGSAATLEAAIFAHLGQAVHSNEQYLNSLTGDERAAIIAFLESLRAPQ